jgi:hypothetical protein
MAATFSSIIVNNIGTAEVIAYTALSKTIIIGCSLANKLTSTVPGSIWIRRSAVDSYVIKDTRIDTGAAYELNKGNKLVLGVGDSVIASAAIDNSMDLTLSILSGVN